MSSNLSVLQRWLMKPTLFGLKLWILVGILVPLFLLILISIAISLICYRRRKWNRQVDDLEAAISGKLATELEVKEVSRRFSSVTTRNRIVTELEYPDDPYLSVAVKDEWRRSGFGREDEENVIGIECYDVDLIEDSNVTVKRFHSNNSFDDKEFIIEAERIRHVSHKNLVKLLGYCTKGTDNQRMLVYENVDNRNLHQWLHECSEQPFSPLTWPIRMNIIQGIAKGLAYLHEDVEPQILHGCLTSSSILLNQQWNAKITDFGLISLFGSEYWMEPLNLETSGCESLENGSTSLFTERNDVYSFGLLIMEMITGRNPADCNQSQVCLIEWVKSMVGSQQVAETVDSKLEEKPCSKELKRMLLIALRCVDPEMEHRPTMGQILHMLEPRDLLLSDGYQIRRGGSHHRQSSAD